MIPVAIHVISLALAQHKQKRKKFICAEVSESRKQVIQALANLYTIAPMLTKIVIYDSGCLLAKSVRGTFADGSISNEHNNSPGVKALTEVRFFVDRFHLSNHKDVSNY
ncbi:unnamed protein product [Rotaria sp. Silwood1]|nr:unnamed protein product [Rotaria sp. Silwood1]